MSKKLKDDIRKLHDKLDKAIKELEGKKCVHGKKGNCNDCKADKLDSSFREGLKKVNGGNS